METQSFNWKSDFSQGTRVRILNKSGIKEYTDTIGAVRQATQFIRGLWNLAYEAWYPDAVPTSFALDEIPESFKYLGIQEGTHCFQQITNPREKRATSKKDEFRDENKKHQED